MGIFEKMKYMLSNKMVEVTRYQNMCQTNDMEKALKRYNTDKDFLDADSVNFQSVDDLDIGEKYLVSYFMPTIVPISEILWIRFIDVFDRKHMWTLVSDGYVQLLPVNDNSKIDTIIKMLCKRNKKLIYGENKDLKKLFEDDIELFRKLIESHPNENAAAIKVDPDLLQIAERKKAEKSNKTEDTPKNKYLWQSLPKDFMVTDKESARSFFIACDGSYQIMKEHFSQEVYEAFSNIADYQKRREFTKEYALKKFHSILNGEADQIPSVVVQVYNVAEYWGMDFYDDEIIEMLTAVAKFSNEGKLLTNDTWIKNYLNKYNNRGKEIFKVKPLVDMTYNYLMKKYPDNNDYYIGEVLEICSTLRGLMLEMSEPDASLGMQFSLIENKEIDLILDEFSSIYNNNAGYIKEKIYSLNCIYGIKTPEFFITAASEAVDSGSNKPWDRFRFAIVFYHENIAAVFECIRNQDGFFYPESVYREKYPILVQYQDIIAKAIAFYRNRDASEKFRKHLENENPEFSYYNAKADKQKTLCERFGDSFTYLRERIRGQSISHTLTELLDCCEAVSPIIGVDQTEFNDPATEQDIAECENRTGLTLPVKMKEFLQFSNGASLFSNSTTIWETSRIGKYTLDGYDDENAETYLPIGDFIGDGTQFVLNKKTGDIAEWDHETGEVEEYGDFEEFLAMIMDFHCSDYME